MAEGIVSTTPYTCDFEDGCKRGWHLSYYWIYNDGTYSVCDEDGNHEPCDESEVPNHYEECEAWLRYSRYVAETGLDPLRHLFVKWERQVKERWTLQFARSIVGVVLTSARRGDAKHQWLGPASIPEHVAGFARVKDELVPLANRKGPLVTKFEEMPTHLLNRHLRWQGIIDLNVPRPETLVQAELRRLARNRVRQLVKELTHMDKEKEHG